MQDSASTAAAKVDGWTINIPDQETAVTEIGAAANGARGATVFTLNLDHIVKLRSDPSFQEAYRRATFVTADGEPVARLARRRWPAVQRTTGADLVLPLARACANNCIPIFLFGTSPKVLAEAGKQLSRRTADRLQIVGSLSPAADFSPEGQQADQAIDAIKRSAARICFVALGAPKQEVFAARAVAQGARVVFVCIGAGLDFLAGAQVRAPLLFQSLHLEWLWRLATNPRRLALRYGSCVLMLAKLALIAPISGADGQNDIP